MKNSKSGSRIGILGTLLGTLFGALSLGSATNALAASQATVKIKGMSCQACVKSVKKSLSGLSDVASADVEVGKAVVTGKDGKKLDAGQIKSVIEKSGYVVEDVQIQ